jgi:mannose-6-phosphate isomerase-like protein (cupin superfamily)
MIVGGAAVVTRDDELIPVKAGDAIDIPQGARHRISNVGNDEVVFIEIQTGDYFGEDDIERFEDDYGRV